MTRNIQIHLQMQNMLIVTKFQFQVNNNLWNTYSSEFYLTLWQCINSTGFDLAQVVWIVYAPFFENMISLAI